MTASVTYPLGFQAAGVRAGIKSSGPDLGLLVSERPVVAAGSFTTNSLAAAPVVLSRERLANGSPSAVVINSGCANACTGAKGDADALAMATATESALGLPQGEVLVCSTGLIGSRLPMDSVLEAIPAAASALSSDSKEAEQAILTTDTKTKTARFEGEGWKVGGMAKGAGMIAPNMATMLAFLTTDAIADPAALKAVLDDVVGRIFNVITIDGDMSTNDSVILLANGRSGVEPEVPDLLQGVGEVVDSLAYQLVSDAEGSTHSVHIKVVGGASQVEVDAAARAVAGSLLVKCAIWGGDPNWGRIAAALGSAADFSFGSLSIVIGGVPLVIDGELTDAEAEAATEMTADHIEITCRIGTEPFEGNAVTSDLSPEYVTFNGAYKT